MSGTAKSEAMDRLAAYFPGRFDSTLSARCGHTNTLSFIASQPPDAVVWPETALEIVKVLEIATECGMPVIPFGAGTSLEGHVNAPHGGIALDMRRMNAILRTSVADHDCTVEAGVTRRQLNAHLSDTGFFFSVDPGSEDATFGGLAATRASGTNTVRYGTMSDNVLSLTAVMADGRIIETGTRARKSSAGYDLTRLLIGSEGTLGIITALTLRLQPRPDRVAAAVASFPTVAAACAAALALTTAAAGIARVELVDGEAIKAVNSYSKVSLDPLPALFVEWHPGPENTLASTSFDIKRLVAMHGGTGFKSAGDAAERDALWKARYSAFWAISQAWPGRTAVVTDACVPVSRLAQCIGETQSDIAAFNLVAPVIGHVGDGNFHAVAMIDAADKSQVDAVMRVVERLSDRAIAMGGTCSGEHGIGQGKMAAFARQAGSAVSVMREIKRALDPKGILNPGKMFTID